jgi:hypothetical protein
MAAVRCFLEEGRRSLMEKERLGRDALPEISIEGRVRDCEPSLVAITAVILRGVSGRLTKKTLSSSSLVDSSTSAAPATTDLASTSVGACFSSGKIRLKPLVEPLLLESARSLVIRAVKNWAYSGSLSVLAECGCSSGAACPTVLASIALCCNVALR